MKEELEELRKMGMASVINLIYSVSPRHTDKYYVDRAKAAAAINPYRICFKDVGGLLTPDRVRELLPKILKAVGKTPLEFHCHCNNGLGPLNVLEVVKQGVTHIHAAIPPLAHGSSNPSVFNVEKNLRALGYNPEVDISALDPVERHFTHIARREGFPIGAPCEYDQSQYLHQIPGGMISNLRFQLKKIGMEHRIEEILEEAIQVRADFGYPIMVTPLSQFVGSQAGINVIVGERYKEVTDEVIQYALGHWGREAVAVMDKDVRATILDRRRTEAFANWEPPRLSLKEVRRKFGENLSDEELILRVYIDEDAVTIARNAPPPRPYLSAAQPLVALLRALGERPGYTQIQVRRPEFSLTLK